MVCLMMTTNFFESTPPHHEPCSDFMYLTKGTQPFVFLYMFLSKTSQLFICYKFHIFLGLNDLRPLNKTDSCRKNNLHPQKKQHVILLLLSNATDPTNLEVILSDHIGLPFMDFLDWLLNRCLTGGAICMFLSDPTGEDWAPRFRSL